MGSAISYSVNQALSGQAFGYIAIVLVGIFFGSNYVPAKKVPTGDGMAFQWFMAVGIFFWALLMMFLGGFVPVDDPHVSCANTLVFKWWGILGGALWGTGNMMVPKIIDFIGLGMGMLVWGASNFLVGWIIGLVGLKPVLLPSPVSSLALNIVGGTVGVISMGLYAFIKPTLEAAGDSAGDGGHEHLLKGPSRMGTLPRRGSQASLLPLQTSRFDSLLEHEISEVESFGSSHPSSGGGINDDGDESVDDAELKKLQLFGHQLSRNQARWVGFAMAILAGSFYGFCLVPFQIWTESVGPGNGPLEFVFSQGLGIFLISSIYFLIYIIQSGNRPEVYTVSILPAIVCVGYPVGAIAPNVISSIWSVFYFKEIQGRRNFILLGVGLSLNIVCVIMIMLSQLNL